MDATPGLLRARRKAIEDARRETFEQKFLAGPQLFDDACEATKKGIRTQHPHFDEQQVMDELRRRLDIDARLSGEQEIYVSRIEDVIIQKLRWSRDPGRKQDEQDVRDVIAVQAGNLDQSYIREWCDQHGTRERFDRLWRENALPPRTA